MKTGRVIITLYALKLGAQPFTVGVLAAMFSVLPTLLSWHVGRFSDRFGSRWLLMVGAAAGALGMLVPYVIPGLPALFVTSVMYGLLSALSAAPLQNLVGLQSKPQDRAKNFSNLSLVVSFTGFAGPLLAGFSIRSRRPGCGLSESGAAVAGAGRDARCLGRHPAQGHRIHKAHGKRPDIAFGIRALASAGHQQPGGHGR